MLGGALWALASSASATVYVDTRDIGFTSLVGTLDLSITTDDTIGVLTSANITDYSIMFLFERPGQFEQFTLTPANSSFLLNGTGLSATSTGLIFDFGASGFLLFQNPTPGSGGPFYCLQVDACFDFSGPGEAAGPTAGFYLTNYYQGPQVIASSVGGAVPEPASWAMMLLGFGAVGFAMRRSKQSELAFRRVA
jgi:hypothetical protein